MAKDSLVDYSGELPIGKCLLDQPHVGLLSILMKDNNSVSSARVVDA